MNDENDRLQTEEPLKWSKIMVLKGIFNLTFGPDLLDDSG